MQLETKQPPILSQQEYLFSKLTQLFIEYREKVSINASTKTNTTVNDIFLELIRVHMREVARNTTWQEAKPEDLVDKTINDCLSELNQRLQTDVSNTQFLDLDEIFNNLKLKAREIVKLSENLAISRRMQKAGERRQLATLPEQRVQPTEMIEIGLQGAIEGLLIRPLNVHGKLDLDRLGNDYQLSGDWFPFEIHKGDFLFVVDDDGSIFISTENFLKDSFNQASVEIQALAQRIYTI